MRYPTGEMAQLKAREAVYIDRAERLKQRIQNLHDLAEDNTNKLLRTRKRIRYIVHHQE